MYRSTTKRAYAFRADERERIEREGSMKPLHVSVSITVALADRLSLNRLCQVAAMWLLGGERWETELSPQGITHRQTICRR